MNCPFCGQDNLPGTDSCEACGGDLTSVDGDDLRARLKGGPLGDCLSDVGTLMPGIVNPEDSVASALGLMRQDPRGSVLICEDDKLVGIFTERDLIRRVEDGADLEAITMNSVMTQEPYTYRPDDSVAYAINGMTVWGNRHLPILDEEESIEGFISVRKVLRHIKEKHEV